MLFTLVPRWPILLIFLFSVQNARADILCLLKNFWHKEEQELVQAPLDLLEPGTPIELLSKRGNSYTGRFEKVAIGEDGEHYLVLRSADNSLHPLRLTHIDFNSIKRPYEKLKPESPFLISDRNGQLHHGLFHQIHYDKKGRIEYFEFIASDDTLIKLKTRELDESTLQNVLRPYAAKLSNGEEVQDFGKKSYISFIDGKTGERIPAKINTIILDQNKKNIIEVETLKNSKGERNRFLLSDKEFLTARISDTAFQNFSQNPFELKYSNKDLKISYDQLRNDASGFDKTWPEYNAFPLALTHFQKKGLSPPLFKIRSYPVRISLEKRSIKNGQWSLEMEKRREQFTGVENIQYFSVQGGGQITEVYSYYKNSKKYIFRPLEQTAKVQNNFGPRYTLAASEINQMMDLGTVPHSYVGKVNGKMGIISENAHDLAQGPLYKGRSAQHMHADAEGFEYLIGQSDGHLTNRFEHSQGAIFVFDHGGAFSTTMPDKEMIEGGFLTRNEFGQRLPKQYSSHFVQQISDAQFENKLREKTTMLAEDEIRAILFRRQVILEDLKIRGQKALLP